MSKSNTFLSLILLLTSFALLGQGLPFFSSYFFTDPRTSLFQVDHSHNGNLAISIPFRFPAELEFGNFTEKKNPLSYDPIYGLQVFSPVVPFTSLNPFRNPEGNFDPNVTRNSSTILNHQPNVTYVFYRRGFTFDLGLSFGMSLNHGAIGFVDMAESKVRIKYRLNRNLFSFIKNSRFELFLQLSELHRFDGNDFSNRFNTALKVQEPSRTNFIGRQVYVSPGISFSNSNLTLEGMVRLPLNSREANRTLDELWTPEVQGNLGLKYLIPVTPTK